MARTLSATAAFCGTVTLTVNGAMAPVLIIAGTTTAVLVGAAIIFQARKFKHKMDTALPRSIEESRELEAALAAGHPRVRSRSSGLRQGGAAG